MALKVDCRVVGRETMYCDIKVDSELLPTTRHAGAGAEVSVSPVMGKGFRMERAPTADHPTCLLFATGSGISPIKALKESNELKVWLEHISYQVCC